MVSERQVASFFDAENTKAACVDDVRRDLLQRGRLLIRKAYGDFQSAQLKAWIPVCKQFAIDMVSRPAVAAGKNASDIAMCIDAMECLVTRTNIDTFALVTSDSDCTPLALRLREHGKFVLGFGQTSSPTAFRQACDEFILLEQLKYASTNSDGAANEDTTSSESDSLSCKRAAHLAVRQAFNELATHHGSSESWVDTDHLLNYMVRLQKDFRSLLSSWACKWTQFLREDAYFELCEEKAGYGYNYYIRRSEKSSEDLPGEPEPEVTPRKARKRMPADVQTVEPEVTPRKERKRKEANVQTAEPKVTPRKARKRELADAQTTEPGDGVESNTRERSSSTKKERGRKGAEGKDPSEAMPTLRGLRRQVRSLLRANGAKFVNLNCVSDALGPKKLRATVKALGYRKLGDFVAKMKKIELVVMRGGEMKVRLQQ